MKILIGEVAKITNISKQTLRYYDKIGILRPKGIDENSGYRYYSIDQLEQLDVILCLKELGMSLIDIRKYLDKRNIEESIILLEKQNEIIQGKIQEYEAMGTRIAGRIKNIKKWKDIRDEDRIVLRKISKRHMIAVDSELEASQYSIEEGFGKLFGYLLENTHAFNNQIGVTISKENIEKEKFEVYKSLYLQLEGEIDHENYKTIKANNYMCMYHRGAYLKTFSAYNRIKKYIKDNKYEIIGDAIEVSLIDGFVVKDENEFLTEIQIPVRKL